MALMLESGSASATRPICRCAYELRRADANHNFLYSAELPIYTRSAVVRVCVCVCVCVCV